MSSDHQSLAPTGIEPIDAALGGLEPGRAHVVYGELETGKTTLAMHYLVEGLRRGETCVFVVRYDPTEVVRAMRAVGYDCEEDLRAERLVIFEYSWDLV